MLAALNGSIVAFSLEACPEGWEAYAPAAGRFIRGIAKDDPDGIRPAGSIQSA